MQNHLSSSPFLLKNISSYENWRKQKLQNYPTNKAELIVTIKNPYQLTQNEYTQLLAVLKKTNLVIYQVDDDVVMDKPAMLALSAQFGLHTIDHTLTAEKADGINALQVEGNEKPQHDYIPYTDKAINWHTDGYYNAPEAKVQAMLLHCTRPALQGGINQLVDHEMAYIHLRDENPAYIEALMAEEAMIIPANVQGGQTVRAKSVGSVFSITEEGMLYMRYTARKRNIIWKQDNITQEAVACLTDFLNSDSPYIYTHGLTANQGLLCNNVLHNRTGFTDDLTQKRLLYRIRFYDRIT